MWDINNWGRQNFADERKTFAWWCWSHLLLSAGQEDFQSSSPNVVYFLRSPTWFQMLFALCFLLNTIKSNSQPLSWVYVNFRYLYFTATFCAVIQLCCLRLSIFPFEMFTVIVIYCNSDIIYYQKKSLLPAVYATILPCLFFFFRQNQCEEEFLCLNSPTPACHISSGPPATIAAISNHVSRQFNASLSTPAPRRVPNFFTQTETYFEQQQRFANGSGLNPTPTDSGWLILLSAPNPFAESFFKNQHFGVTIVGYWVWKINKLIPF